MALTFSPEHAERRLTAEALRNLREARRPKIGQPQIAEALGISTQAWQKHETGERSFTEEKIDTALAVIGATRDELEAEKARILGRAPDPAPDRRGDFTLDVFGRAPAEGPSRKLDLRHVIGPSVAGMQAPDDALSPWVERGELVLFDREAEPRKGRGCVVELKSGERLVRLYEKSDGSTLFVRELSPDDKVVNLPQRDVRGVYPVILRGD